VQHVILASVYAGPDAEYQLNTLSDGDAIDVIPSTSSIIVISSVGRISEWRGLRSRHQRRGGRGSTAEGNGVWEGAVPPPQKILHFLHQNYTSVMHS